MPLEVLVGAAVGAAVVSSPVRKQLRKGMVYGLAGLLVAYDKVSALSQGVVKGARNVVASSGQEEKKEAAPAPQPVAADGAPAAK
jgi:hypothetical protein